MGEKMILPRCGRIGSVKSVFVCVMSVNEKSKKVEVFLSFFEKYFCRAVSGDDKLGPAAAASGLKLSCEGVTFMLWLIFSTVQKDSWHY